ncbi:enolase-phosphatase E1 [[Candida] railenensis]|uniref:Enolase-phosphatase E1 n=1 Tax=[Candida] railenensis TaxID=45579 RepID=A0A9P0VX51_9ASCO|nr:enolase-phosphatase E1 [[Candida] railenensis]
MWSNFSSVSSGCSAGPSSLRLRPTMTAVIIDIEGTVCSISFVKDTLFPYFLREVPAKLESLDYPIKVSSSVEDSESARISNILVGFPQEVVSSYETTLSHITHLVSSDIKDPVLKSLQGLIWSIGYHNGDLRAPIYPDAIKLIESFKEGDPTRKIYVYSSGSVRAQKLLFGHVSFEDSIVDLNPYFSGYFDITTSGFKQESQSYKNILESIGQLETPDQVLFLSDNVKEVDAANSAGMKSIVVVRPGNSELTEDDRKRFKVIDDFSQLQI